MLHCFNLTHNLMKSFDMDLSGEPSQDNGAIQANQYSTLSPPPSSPVAQEEPFSTYFEEKVHIPENVSQVRP